MFVPNTTQPQQNNRKDATGPNSLFGQSLSASNNNLASTQNLANSTSMQNNFAAGLIGAAGNSNGGWSGPNTSPFNSFLGGATNTGNGGSNAANANLSNFSLGTGYNPNSLANAQLLGHMAAGANPNAFGDITELV